MFCKPYRKTLSEAAIRGEALPRAAETHLAGCAACRAAFAGEQALMGLVDKGLWSIANAEEPVSLVPRVRARIAEVPVAQAWHLGALGFAAAALAVAGIAGWLWYAPRNAFRQEQTNVSSQVSSSAENRAPRALPPRSAPRKAEAAGIDRTVRHVMPVYNEPVVLVSPEERVGLQRYLASLSARRQNGSLLAAAATSEVNGIAPLEIAALDLKELTTEPLESGASK